MQVYVSFHYLHPGDSGKNKSSVILVHRKKRFKIERSFGNSKLRGTIKTSPWSYTVCPERNSKFTSPSPAMVTSPYRSQKAGYNPPTSVSQQALTR
jgi:hypothetical protein